MEAEQAARRMRESRHVSDEEKAALLRATREAEARAVAMQQEAEKRDREARELSEVRLGASSRPFILKVQARLRSAILSRRLSSHPTHA